jgi:hypothetical protein
VSDEERTNIPAAELVRRVVDSVRPYARLDGDYKDKEVTKEEPFSLFKFDVVDFFCAQLKGAITEEDFKKNTPINLLKFVHEDPTFQVPLLHSSLPFCCSSLLCRDILAPSDSLTRLFSCS